MSLLQGADVNVMLLLNFLKDPGLDQGPLYTLGIV